MSREKYDDENRRQLHKVARERIQRKLQEQEIRSLLEEENEMELDLDW